MWRSICYNWQWVCHIAVGGILAHSSLQNCFNSASLEGFQAWTAYLRSCHSISITFKSGLWLGQSKTFIFFWATYQEGQLSPGMPSWLSAGGGREQDDGQAVITAGAGVPPPAGHCHSSFSNRLIHPNCEGEVSQVRLYEKHCSQ